MLNSFSINPENDCYQQRRSKNNNEKEPIFFLHGITGARHFKSEITCIPAGVPNQEADNSLTPTGQKMDIYRNPFKERGLNTCWLNFGQKRFRG